MAVRPLRSGPLRQCSYCGRRVKSVSRRSLTATTTTTSKAVDAQCEPQCAHRQPRERRRGAGPTLGCRRRARARLGLFDRCEGVRAAGQLQARGECRHRERETHPDRLMPCERECTASDGLVLRRESVRGREKKRTFSPISVESPSSRISKSLTRLHASSVARYRASRNGRPKMTLSRTEAF